MKIAYIISAYKLPGMLARLVNRLDGEGASFYIHIDRKSPPEVHAGAAQSLANRPNVAFLEPHVCYWGDFGHVRATLKGIRALVESRAPFDYAFLLTGQDYPIRSNAAIRAFLQASEGKSYIDYFALPYPHWEDRGGLDRLDYRHWFWNKLHLQLPRLKRGLPGGLAPYGGGSYWCLSRRCIETVHAYDRSHPELARFFERARIPDELFFQTILLNSPLAGELVNDDLRYVDWSKPGVEYPAVLRMEDLGAVLSSGKLFARKFDPTVDPAILDALDRAAAEQP